MVKVSMTARLTNIRINKKELTRELVSNRKYRAAIRLSTEYVEQKLIDKSPTGASGKFIASWEHSYTIDQTTNIVWRNTSQGALFRNAGRGPGKPPLGADSFERIQKWVVFRGMPVSSAWGVAVKIGREGTERWKDGTNAIGIDNKNQVIPGGYADVQLLRDFIEKFKSIV